MHNKRDKKTGKFKSEKTVLERFFDKVEKDESSGCWNWKASKDHDGYGYFFYRGDGSQRSHKAAYMIFIGEIPKGMCVCHKCDNPGCVNPEHLWVGTFGDNDRDREKKGRGNHAVGEDMHHSDLKEKDIVLIREMYATGHYTTEKLGKMFNVSPGTIGTIKNRKSWKHVK